MGLLDWINKRKHLFTRYDDAFALNRSALWRSLQQTVTDPQHAAKSIWLVVHFVDTFTSLQAELESWRVDYEVVTQPIDPNHLERSGLLSCAQIKVVLSELIPESKGAVLLDTIPDNQIAMIVVERHPQIKYDDQIESFARMLPVAVEMGYYLSLDDEVIRLVINETSIEILQQLGMNEHELIASRMVTRRLNIMLKRISENFDSDERADSAQQWLEVNGSKSEL